MARCIQLAKQGMGSVAPNPMVGAVIVHQDKIIGEGYHQRYGEAHAEVNAVQAVSNQGLIPESTIYVSLEPCAHHGKTPPCADLLVAKNFKRVVIGCRDANSDVDGKGIQRLKNAGIEVRVGVLEQECHTLNKRFFTWHEKKRPFVLLKWAQTQNGLIDNASNDDQVSWISAPETQTLVHTWRLQNQAILVGRKTVENDNPSLTVRAVNGNNPVRIILDSELQLPNDRAIFDSQAATIILNKKSSKKAENIQFIQIEEMTPSKILEVLSKNGIQSVLIEGGRATLQSFIDAKIWDEAKVIVGQQTFEQGTHAPQLDATPNFSEKFFGDTIHTYVNE